MPLIERRTPDQPVQILLVEDDEDYAFLAREAFGKAPLPAKLHHVDDGRKCLQFLRREPPFQDAPTPDIVLLDLDMPVMDGRQTMAQIVADEGLRHLPVLVLTNRIEDAEIVNMYRLRCNSYICKPKDFQRYVEVMTKVVEYWFTVAEMPVLAQN